MRPTAIVYMSYVFCLEESFWRLYHLHAENTVAPCPVIHRFFVWGDGRAAVPRARIL